MEGLRKLLADPELWNAWVEKQRAKFLRWRAILRGVDLSGADLSGADLRDVDLAGADLSGAILRGADLAGADLSGADLAGADLTYAKLHKADLVFANLREANLHGADLTYAKLHKADLAGADLTGATPQQGGQLSGSFLELAGCEGLTTVKGLDVGRYLHEAFAFAHRKDTVDARLRPYFVEHAIEKIRDFQQLQAASTVDSPRLVQALDVLTAQLIDYLKHHPKQLYGIPPRIFEEIVAEVLSSFGWHVDLTPKSNDGGYDIFALSPNGKAGVDASWIIECKRYAEDRPVGVDIVRALYGSNLLNRREQAAGMTMLATTSHFTAGAKAFKASRYDLALKDYEGILDWLNTYRPNSNGRLYIDSGGQLVVPGEE